jgi:hypothetical protein
LTFTEMPTLTRKTPKADMERIRALNPKIIDDIWPGHVLSYKYGVKGAGLNDCRIVYFHGRQKPGEIGDEWMKENWKWPMEE